MKKYLFTSIVALIIFLWACKNDVTIPSQFGWDRQTIETSYDVMGISFVDSVNGWAVTAYSNPDSSVIPVYKGEIYNTTNGGSSWSQLNTIDKNRYFAVYFLNKFTGWIAGGYGLIQRTDNGGSSWNTQLVDSSVTFQCIYFLDSLNGWASGWAGVIYHTSNGGYSWQKQNSKEYANLFNIQFINKNVGFAGGGRSTTVMDTIQGQLYYTEYGAVLKTTNGGDNWFSILADSNLIESSYLRSMHFVDENNGWACGSNGVILHTNNSGGTWVPQYSNNNYTLGAVYFTDLNHGSICGYQGLLLVTFDGGSTWKTQTTPASGNYLYFMTYIDQRHGWIAGDKGTILFTQNGGVDIK